MELTLNNEFSKIKELKEVYPSKGYETIRVFISTYRSQTDQ